MKTAEKQLSANIQNVLSGDNETGSAYDGEYRIDNGKTTKGIDNVTVDNNTVDIYLVKVGEGGSEQAKRSCDTDRPIQADRSEPADGLFAADNISRDVLCTKQQSADRRRRSSHRPIFRTGPLDRHRSSGTCRHWSSLSRLSKKKQ